SEFECNSDPKYLAERFMRSYEEGEFNRWAYYTYTGERVHGLAGPAKILFGLSDRRKGFFGGERYFLSYMSNITVNDEELRRRADEVARKIMTDWKRERLYLYKP
ncbi:MAG: hypothetical protein Q8P81_00005, partial [Nanoarchaeota archaeon]|nr:hypothetical protein [Nanoarchaeota archaeon]